MNSPNHTLSDAFLDGGPAPTTTKSLWEHLTASVERYPDNKAIIIPYQSHTHCAILTSPTFTSTTNSISNPINPKGAHLEWTYKQLHTAATSLANALHASHHRRGDIIVTLIENSIEWCIIYWACIALGITMAPLDATMLQRPEELKYYLDLLKPKTVVVGDSIVGGSAVDTAVGGCHDVSLKAKIGLATGTSDENASRDADNSNWQLFTPFILSHNISAHLNATYATVTGPPDQDLALSIAFTSGTSTGHPKGCVRTHLAAYIASRNYIDAESIDSSTRYLICSVCFRIISVTMTLVLWLAGGTAVFGSERFDPMKTLKAMSQVGCTNVIGVPAFLYAWKSVPREALGAGLKWPGRDTGLKYVKLGGDMMRRDHIELTRKIFGPDVRMVVGFGMSEGGAMLCWRNMPEAFENGFEIPVMDGGICSLGSAGKGSMVKIVKAGSKSKEVVKRGGNGELHFSSEAVVRTYLGGRNPEDFYEDERGQRWFITGDVAMIDEKGWAYILGRVKDVIKYKGISLSPAVLEGALNTRDDVLIKVVGQPHPEYGAFPVAIVRCSKTEDRAALSKELTQQAFRSLGEDYTPKAVYFIDELGFKDFPLNATGKVVARELQDAIGRKCAL